MIALLALLGCPPAPTCGDGCPADTDAPTADTSPPEATGTLPTGDPCGPDPALTVLALQASDGPSATQRAVSVDLSGPASVAVRCVADDDPDELHLLESAGPATHHELRFSGLLPDHTYTCVAAPTCPTTAGAPAASVALVTGGAPALSRPSVEVEPGGSFTGAFTLTAWKDHACGAAPSWIVVYDPDGAPRWWRPFPPRMQFVAEVRYHPEIDAIVWGGGEVADGYPRITSVWDGDLYASENLPKIEGATFHHDSKRLADGRLMTLETRQNSLLDVTWEGFGVRVFDPTTGRIDVDLDSQRYVTEQVLRPGPMADRPSDPYHANWVDLAEHPDGDRVYVSLCFDHSILALDAATGSVRWKLQKDDGWVVRDPAGATLSEDMLPECQHGLEVVGDDVLLVYDNGRDRRRSQITELAVDGADKVVTVRWRWTDGWYESSMGDVDVLSDERVLVTQGHGDCFVGTTPTTRILEVDRSTGEVASRMIFPTEADAVYRAERYDGCALLPGTRYCPETLRRAAELEASFGPSERRGGGTGDRGRVEP